MTNATQHTPDAYGKRLILAGGYEYEVTAKHREWLDHLDAQIAERDSLRAALDSSEGEADRLRAKVAELRAALAQANMATDCAVGYLIAHPSDNCEHEADRIKALTDSGTHTRAALASKG